MYTTGRLFICATLVATLLPLDAQADLTISENGRYLKNPDGTPFLLARRYRLGPVSKTRPR
jgi:hypothetical protein